MKNKRNITIKVIQDNVVNNSKLARYFAEKYREESEMIQSQNRKKKGSQL